MKTVNDIWESLNARLRKNNSNRGVDPLRFNPLLANAFLRELRFQTGLPETFVPGQSPAQVALDNSQRSMEYMEPLLVVRDAENPLAYGSHIDLAQIMMITGLASITHEQIGGKNKAVISPTDMLLSGELFHRLNHPIKGPDKMFPVAYYLGDKKLKIQPAPDMVSISYYKVPKTPFRDFTISTSGTSTYLPEGQVHNGSVLPAGTPSRTQQPELDFRAYESIENRLYEMVSVRIGDQQGVAVAAQRKASGQ